MQIHIYSGEVLGKLDFGLTPLKEGMLNIEEMSSMYSGIGRYLFNRGYRLKEGPCSVVHMHRNSVEYKQTFISPEDDLLFNNLAKFLEAHGC